MNLFDMQNEDDRKSLTEIARRVHEIESTDDTFQKVRLIDAVDVASNRGDLLATCILCVLTGARTLRDLGFETVN